MLHPGLAETLGRAVGERVGLGPRLFVDHNFGRRGRTLYLPAPPQVVGPRLRPDAVGRGDAKVAPRTQFGHIARAIREPGIRQAVRGGGRADERDVRLRGDRDFADGHAAVEGTDNGRNPRVAGDVGEILVFASHTDGTALPTVAPAATHR